MRKKFKNIWFRLFSKRKLQRIDRDRSYSYKRLNIQIEPGIFHPRYFDSSQMLLQWVEQHDVKDKRLIEVGCGSGITSLRAAQKNANVWAIDIHEKAVKLLKRNASENNLQLEVLCSDLFEAIPKLHFDFVLVNPPFYPKNPSTEAEKAWFCGDNYQYFHQLFKQLNERNLNAGIFMTLSDDCDLKQIQSIAKSQGYHFHLKKTRKSFFEKNFLFAIHKAS